MLLIILINFVLVIIDIEIPALVINNAHFNVTDCMNTQSCIHSSSSPEIVSRGFGPLKNELSVLKHEDMLLGPKYGRHANVRHDLPHHMTCYSPVTHFYTWM